MCCWEKTHPSLVPPRLVMGVEGGAWAHLVCGGGELAVSTGQVVNGEQTPDRVLVPGEEGCWAWLPSVTIRSIPAGKESV